MGITRDNHYVAQWYQKGFMSDGENKLWHLTTKMILLPNGELKKIENKKKFTSAQKFYAKDLYSIFFGENVNDEIERKLFGPIDNNGFKAINAFLTDDQTEWHNNFLNFFTYMDAQRIRTPKGLDWLMSKYPTLNQIQLMSEMQKIRLINCSLWSECIRELVSAEESEVKFVISDHPITIYNKACPPDSDYCEYPNDPDIAFKGSQTLFPLDKNRCLILTHNEYAKDPINTDPLELRANIKRSRESFVSTVEFINTRKLTLEEVTKINYIFKKCSKESIAAGCEDWLFPENEIKVEWGELQDVLLPPKDKIHTYDDMFVKFDDGSIHYQDQYGRSNPPLKFLFKTINEKIIGRNDICGCGSGKKYKSCCKDIPKDLRTTWAELSIRERNLAFCTCIRDVLGLEKGNTWKDVQKNLSEEQILQIYDFYSVLWPRDTDIYSLLPKSDGKFRGLYTGIVDQRKLFKKVLPLASYFDELLIMMPVANPNILKSELSPLTSPNKYKYQALKDFHFMLQMEPYIHLGIINPIPDPSDFDLVLKKELYEILQIRNMKNIKDIRDIAQLISLNIDDALNSLGITSTKVRIGLLSNFGVTGGDAENMIKGFEQKSEKSPLILLQDSADLGGQFFQFNLLPNYEMSLFIAQITGSIIVSDSKTRLSEFLQAQHREQGIINYPWDSISSLLKELPLDLAMLQNFQKTQTGFTKIRDILKQYNDLVIKEDFDKKKSNLISTNIEAYMQSDKFSPNEKIGIVNVKILSPKGGFYDINVQRLLLKSGCLKYDKKVRSVYGIDIN